MSRPCVIDIDVRQCRVVQQDGVRGIRVRVPTPVAAQLDAHSVTGAPPEVGHTDVVGDAGPGEAILHMTLDALAAKAVRARVGNRNFVLASLTDDQMAAWRAAGFTVYEYLDDLPTGWKRADGGELVQWAGVPMRQSAPE